MEQRKAPRSTITTLVKVVYLDQVYLAETIDVSLSGLSCFLPISIPTSQAVLVSFRLEPKMKPITTWAYPAQTFLAQSGRYRIGLMFKDLGSEDYQLLTEALSEKWPTKPPSPSSTGKGG